MSIYRVAQTVDYVAEEIEADSEDEAMQIYWANQESYYVGVSEEEIRLVAENN